MLSIAWSKRVFGLSINKPMSMMPTQRFEGSQFAVGERVMIRLGPLGGLDGVVVENRAPRVVLRVQLIHTSTCVEMDQDSLVLLRPERPAGNDSR